jgi:hypothetical protein
MDVTTRIAGIDSGDRIVQGEAYQALLEASNEPVAWAYEVWEDLLKALTHRTTACGRSRPSSCATWPRAIPREGFSTTLTL